ncbi:zinc-binding dehydrogenase [Novosphingobium soli]|uniref:Zinc-binding dehydrogenase n=1 Tax=Novosphingobium soli TaxID=574956 RepID=A0ABV6CZK9_9SPHN
MGDLPDSYRAWTWQGDAEPCALIMETRALGSPGPGEVLVRNVAVGLNPIDWKVLDGRLDWQPGHFPGVDGAGVVVRIGTDVPESWLGHRVAYHQSLTAHGSYADFVPIHADVLLDVPDGLDLEIAASVPCPALTAWLALAKLPELPGASMLVSGAGGAVGNYLVQLAHRRGWRVTVSCHERHRERLLSLGAAAWVPGPLAPGEAWAGQAWAGERFTAVINSVRGEHAARLAPALRANGHLVCIQDRIETWPDPPFTRSVSLHEVALGAMHAYGDAEDWARLTEVGAALLADIAAGRLQPEPLVEGTFGTLPDHLDALRNRNFSGKPIVRLP